MQPKAFFQLTCSLYLWQQHGTVWNSILEPCRPQVCTWYYLFVVSKNILAESNFYIFI